jgi:hypothetical protein
MVTVADDPPAISWVSTHAPLVLSLAEYTATGVELPPAAARIGFGNPPADVVNTIPDGSMLTVVVPFPMPGAEAVNVTGPVPPSA